MVGVGSVPVLGRLDPATLGVLADLAKGTAGELRISPWRSVLLTNIAEADAPEVVAACDGVGLISSRPGRRSRRTCSSPPTMVWRLASTG